jgi:hypothetical protein
MKAKTLLVLLLLAHLVAHPAMHGLVVPEAVPALARTASGDGPNEAPTRPEGSTCYVCRTAHALSTPQAAGGISLAIVAERPCATPVLKPEAARHSTLPARAPPASQSVS